MINNVKCVMTWLKTSSQNRRRDQSYTIDPGYQRYPNAGKLRSPEPENRTHRKKLMEW